MSIKNEDILTLDPQIEIKIEISDEKKNNDSNKTQDKITEEVNIKTYEESKPLIEESSIFVCKNCYMTERYDSFSDHLKFNRNVRTKINYYLTRDPFSPRSKKQFLILGSICSICNKDVCIKPECSIFYSNFFCSMCARKYIDRFPVCIQEKIKKKCI